MGDEAFRALCKHCVNTMLNAVDDDDARNGFWLAFSTWTDGGQKKSINSKNYQDAANLNEHRDKCQGIRFEELYQLVLDKHPLLRDRFLDGKSTGLELQSIDSLARLEQITERVRLKGESLR